jgi:ribosomal protein S18 acetylase RimI-like enzyme
MDPPDTPGAAWRPITAEDIPGVVELAAAVDAVEDLEFAGGPGFWEWWLGQHDPETDTLLGIDPDERFVAIAGAYSNDTAAGARSILWMDAHPDRLDLEPPLLAWTVGRGREQVAASDHDEKTVRMSVEEHRARRRDLLEASGFAIARTFVEMVRSLTDDLPEETPLPPGVDVVPWSSDQDEPARLVSNAAFAGHWGSLPMDEETWTSMVMDDEVNRRDLSFVAYEDDEPIAICLTEVDPEDEPSKLYVQRVGTVPEHRRRGLATALLSRVLRAAAAAGLTSTALTVDEESRFDATALYARLGYRVTTRTISYALQDLP